MRVPWSCVGPELARGFLVFVVIHESNPISHEQAQALRLWRRRVSRMYYRTDFPMLEVMSWSAVGHISRLTVPSAP
jgi:hypothetical protein